MSSEVQQTLIDGTIVVKDIPLRKRFRVCMKIARQLMANVKHNAVESRLAERRRAITSLLTSAAPVCRDIEKLQAELEAADSATALEIANRLGASSDNYQSAVAQCRDSLTRVRPLPEVNYKGTNFEALAREVYNTAEAYPETRWLPNYGLLVPLPAVSFPYPGLESTPDLAIAAGPWWLYFQNAQSNSRTFSLNTPQMLYVERGRNTPPGHIRHTYAHPHTKGGTYCFGEYERNVKALLAGWYLLPVVDLALRVTQNESLKVAFAHWATMRLNDHQAHEARRLAAEDKQRKEAEAKFREQQRAERLLEEARAEERRRLERLEREAREDEEIRRKLQAQIAAAAPVQIITTDNTVEIRTVKVMSFEDAPEEVANILSDPSYTL